MPDIRIEGPYKHRDKWRCRLCTEGNRRWAGVADSPDHAKANAEAEIADYRASAELTVGDLVDKYAAYLAMMGRKAGSIKTVRAQLRELAAPFWESSVVGMSGRAAKERYLSLGHLAAATHQRALRCGRSCWAWAKDEGLAKTNPWAAIKPVGRASKGKPQLTLDEGRKLRKVCLAALAAEILPDRAEDGALAILMALLMGLRSGEITARVVRDVDDGGRVLRVPFSKTEAGKRSPQIPDDIAAAVRARIIGSAADTPLIAATHGLASPANWLRDELRKYCKLAGVPVVCPHALRGGWATIATDAGALSHLVSKALGHKSEAVTEAHYTSADAINRAQQRERNRALDGDRPN